jgi:23S rRNA (guanosine2251-2'-O)-methyltransferase
LSFIMSPQYVYGLHSVSSLAKHRAGQIEAVWVQRERQDARLKELVALLQRHGIAVQVVSRKELEHMAAESVHQGVIARVKPSEQHDEGFLESLLDNLAEPALLLVLDEVTDPHNLGACLRSADAAGAHAVITPKDNAAALTPVVRKVASGAAEVIPFIQVTNLARTLSWLKQRGVWLVGTAGEATQSIYEMDLKGSIAIVMGAEGKGMRRLTKESCDYLAYIPMAGTVESLNVSVATGVCLFEAVRQRKAL